MIKSIAILRRDPRFRLLIKKHGVPDRKLRKNPFQSLVRSIVYQQLSGKAAAAILGRFLDLFPGKDFPTPQAVNAMPMIRLRKAGLSGQKTLYIKDLAKKFSDGTIRPHSLHRMSNAEVIEHLLRVKGIGVWTVHMFLMNTLKRPDILPTGDLGIRKGFQIVYNLKKLPDHKTMERLAASWRKHASVASWYLWRAVEAAREKN